MIEPTLLGLCGSLRAGSLNRQLLAEARRHFGAATYLEGDLRLPLYDGDLEADAGIPAEVLALAGRIRQADAVVIASPEYNKGITGVMKNALDWISRVDGAVLRDKPTAVISANAGRTGGETGQYMTRACLVPLGPQVLTHPMVMVAGGEAEFDAEGRLASASYDSALARLMEHLRAAAVKR